MIVRAPLLLSQRLKSTDFLGCIVLMIPNKDKMHSVALDYWCFVDNNIFQLLFNRTGRWPRAVSGLQVKV